MGKFTATWSLMSASWDVLKKDKEMMVFQLFSFIGCLLVMASFIAPMVYSGSIWDIPEQGATGGEYIRYYGSLYLFYVCTYFVIVFFNAAIAYCAVMRLEGEDPTLKDGFSAAVAVLPAIFGWVLFLSTVALILRIIEERSELVGSIIARLLGGLWSLASFLVVPILVVKGLGPIDALKNSARLLKSSWGEQLIGSFSFGLVFFVLGLAAVIPAYFGITADSQIAMFVGLGIAVLYLIVLSLVQATLQAIFQAALYLTVRNGEAPEGFNSKLLR